LPRDDEDLPALVDNPGSTCPSPLSSTVLAGLFLGSLIGERS
jgi:hypothetical protein